MCKGMVKDKIIFTGCSEPILVKHITQSLRNRVYVEEYKEIRENFRSMSQILYVVSQHQGKQVGMIKLCNIKLYNNLLVSIGSGELPTPDFDHESKAL